MKYKLDFIRLYTACKDKTIIVIAYWIKKTRNFKQKLTKRDLSLRDTLGNL